MLRATEYWIDVPVSEDDLLEEQVTDTRLGSAMATGGNDNFGSLFDHRIIGKPKPLGSNRAEWKDWKFEMQNFMCLVHAQFTDDMKVAEMEREPVTDDGNMDLRRRSTMLFAILALARRKFNSVIARTDPKG